MKYRKGYKYQLANDFKVNLNEDHWDEHSFGIDTEYISLHGSKLSIKKGYAWDGATCFPDTKSIIIGSLIHDALYQLIRNSLLEIDSRLYADKELLYSCKRHGMWSFMASLVFNSVRKFAKFAASPKNKKKIYEVQ